MSDSYVTSKATMKCSCGDRQAKLTVYPDRTVFLTEKPMANISDHISLYNIAPFGRCHTTRYPATGAATAANHGRLTPMPCIPGTVTEWINGKNDYIIKGKPALLKSSYCRCKWGGVIRIIDDGQEETDDFNFIQEPEHFTEVKNIPYERELVTSYSPQFIHNDKASGNRARELQQMFSKEVSLLFSSCEITSNWLGSPVPNKKHYTDNIRFTEEKSNENSFNSNTGATLSENGEIKTIYCGITYYDVQIEQIKNDLSGIKDYGKLFLYTFNSIPRIRNTKISLSFIINPLVAGLIVTISVGVDNYYNRYIQLEIDSFVGGDYTDLANYKEINDYLKKKKYNKAFKKLAKKYGKKLSLSKIIKLKTAYHTCVSQPVYNYPQASAYFDLNLKYDKLLEIKCGTSDVTNISDIWENGSVSIYSKLSFPNLDVEFGWDSNKLDSNAGIFLNITRSVNFENNRPIGLSQINKDQKESKEFYEKSIYQPNDSDIVAEAKLGSQWSYAWLLDNLIHNKI